MDTQTQRDLSEIPKGTRVLVKGQPKNSKFKDGIYTVGSTYANGICYRCKEDTYVNENSICNNCEPRDE